MVKIVELSFLQSIRNDWLWEVFHRIYIPCTFLHLCCFFSYVFIVVECYQLGSLCINFCVENFMSSDNSPNSSFCSTMWYDDTPHCNKPIHTQTHSHEIEISAAKSDEGKLVTHKIWWIIWNKAEWKLGISCYPVYVL